MKKKKIINRPKRKPFPYIPKSIFDDENWGGKKIRKTQRRTASGEMVDVGFGYLIALVLGTVLAVMFVISLDEKIINNKCETLKSQSEEFEMFFVSYSHKIMCDEAGFTFAGTLNAPVHTDTIPRVEGEGYLKNSIWYINDAGKFYIEANNYVITDKYD